MNTVQIIELLEQAQRCNQDADAALLGLYYPGASTNLALARHNHGKAGKALYAAIQSLRESIEVPLAS